jgi:DNA-binding NarL/FixJ family response regulator
MLVCDGARVLSWVGLLYEKAMTEATRTGFARVLRHVRRRLIRERQFQHVNTSSRALDVLLAQHPGAALVITRSGHILNANSLALDLLATGGGDAIAAACRADSARFTRSLVSPQEEPATYLLLEAHRPPTSSRAVAAAAVFGLTPKQRDVLVRVLGGETNKEIAAALFVGESTVEYHVTKLLEKVGVNSRTGLVARVWQDA